MYYVWNLYFFCLGLPPPVCITSISHVNNAFLMDEYWFLSVMYVICMNHLDPLRRLYGKQSVNFLSC